MLFRIGVLKKFAIFTGKHRCWSLFLINKVKETLQSYEKETPTQVFSREICEVFKNTYFEEHLRAAAKILKI